MKTYNIQITGTQPLIMHADDIDWADKMSAWRDQKDNKKKSKAGDDRTPAFRWIGYLYRNTVGQIIIPTENIMRCLMEGAATIILNKNKTFKSASQSGIIPRSVGWELMLDGRPIDTSPLAGLLKENDYEKHEESASQMGFALFKKRAKIGTSKHVRVRPMFHNWSASGQLVVTDANITTNILRDIFSAAGSEKGLGDWRPSSKTPGFYGMFDADVSEA